MKNACSRLRTLQRAIFEKLIRSKRTSTKIEILARLRAHANSLGYIPVQIVELNRVKALRKRVRMDAANYKIPIRHRFRTCKLRGEWGNVAVLLNSDYSNLPCFIRDTSMRGIALFLGCN